MNPVYVEMNEDDLTDIVLHIEEHQAANDVFFSEMINGITLQQLRNLIFNGSVYISALKHEGEIIALAILTFPKAGSISTAMEVLYLTLNPELTKMLFSVISTTPLIITPAMKYVKATKVKAVTSSNQFVKIGKLFSDVSFDLELTLLSKTNGNRVYVFSHMI